MRQISRTIGGAAQPQPAAAAPADKWRILAALGDCARDFALGHRELNLLRALLSFLPQRVIEAGAAVVFPSNEALSERLNGLPQSTLRRHLARLVASGLVRRQDSPSRKRYARRDGAGALLRAFGFDLAPLAAAAPAIEAAAARAAETGLETAALREDLALLRQDLLAAAGPEDLGLAEEARRMLRRRAEPEALRALAAALAERLSAVVPRTEDASSIQAAPETSGEGARNERHIQSLREESSDSPSHPISTRAPTKRCAFAENMDEQPEAALPDLKEIAAVCGEAQAFYPEGVSSWRELARTADKVAPMIGIPPHLVDRARRGMGWREAAATVLVMLERYGSIRNPAGYLTHLTRCAEEGRFRLTTLLRAGAPRLSADNSIRC